MTASEAAFSPSPLPAGCRLQTLATHADGRGDLTEIFREEWFASPAPRFWHVMRGRAEGPVVVRVRARDWVYVTLLDGVLFAGLSDLRPVAPGDAIGSAQVTMSETPRQVLAIAPGVAHGFCFPGPALYLLGHVETADPAGQLLCAWDSPGLDIAWPHALAGRPPAGPAGLGYAAFKSQFAALAGSRDNV